MAFLFNCIGLQKPIRKTKNQVNAVVSCREAERQDKVDGKDSWVTVKSFGWKEVEALTMNFSKVIGSGGYSNVYMGRLSGSTKVAVKIHLGSERFYQVFRQEVDILLRLHHKNIVKLLGYCDDSEEGALVFEHVRGGNLQDKLHGNSGETIPWGKRMAIAYQLAEAIEYLHEKCAPQIVHGDIKSSNILLDERQNCRLCDFGSARVGFSSMVLPPTLSPRSRQVMMIGSPGYTDPHYMMTGITSRENDVYGFGVVVLELVSAKEALCPHRGEMLVHTAAPLLEGNVAAETVARFVDPRLAGKYDLEEAKEMLLVAALCLRQPPSLRPSATQILQDLLT